MRREFEYMHPLVIVGYLIFNLIITMSTMNPYIIGLSWAISLIVGMFYEGRRFLLKNLAVMIPVALFTVGIQPLFSHTGSTPLFYINNGAVYRESYIYGIAMFFMLCAVIQWFSVFHILIDSEKMLYLFGKLAPTLGMILSMILRFIPLLRERRRQIHEAQVGMGRGANKGMINAIRYRLKELSILVSWSLENSMETSASMEARGYGLKGRTSYHRFKITVRDIFILVMLLTGFIVTFAMIIMGGFRVYYLPVIYIYKLEWQQICGLVAYGMISVMPVVIELIEIIGHGIDGKEMG